MSALAPVSLLALKELCHMDTNAVALERLCLTWCAETRLTLEWDKGGQPAVTADSQKSIMHRAANMQPLMSGISLNATLPAICHVKDSYGHAAVSRSIIAMNGSAYRCCLSGMYCSLFAAC